MKIKIDATKALSIGVTALGVLGTILSTKVHANEQKAMKSQIKEEVLKELLSKNEGA